MALVTDEEKSKCSHSNRKDEREKPNYWTSKPPTQENF